MARKKVTTPKPKLTDPKKAKAYFEAKIAFTTGPVELVRKVQEGRNIQIVDLRRAEDYAEGHVPGAVNLPKDKWDTLAGLRKDRINVLYCYSQTCHLAALAAIQFAGKGYPVMELEGGFRTWQESGFEVEK